MGLALLAVSGCKFFRHDPGRVLVREGSGASSRVLAKHVDGKSDDVVNVGAADVAPFPSGAGMLALDASGTGFLRAGKASAASVSCRAPAGSSLLGVDDSGEEVLFKSKTASAQTLHFMDLRTCAETTLDVRDAYRGDVAADGKEAVVGAFPTSCTDASLNKCPVTLYRLRPAGSPVPTEVLRGGPRAHYQPRYFPGGKILFQTTELDTACDGTINGCRHDIVSIDVTGGPGAPLALVRRGAIAAAPSADGKRMAYLAYTGSETSCHARLPCTTMTLEIGDWRTSDASKDVAIARGTVSNLPGRPFGLDGRWIAFATGGGYDPQVCRVDGTGCRSYAGTHLIGWMK